MNCYLFTVQRGLFYRFCPRGYKLDSFHLLLSDNCEGIWMDKIGTSVLFTPGLAFIGFRTTRTPGPGSHKFPIVQIPACNQKVIGSTLWDEPNILHRRQGALNRWVFGVGGPAGASLLGKIPLWSTRGFFRPSLRYHCIVNYFATVLTL